MILLVTNSPAKRGLAYYYYLALCDLEGADSIHILSGNAQDFVVSGNLVTKISHKLKSKYFNNYSKWQTARVVEFIRGVKGITNVILFNSAGLFAEDIKKLSEIAEVRLIQYLSDSPSGMNMAKFNSCISTLKYFDHVFVYARSLVPVIYQYGAKRVFYLPFGYCKYTHLKEAPKIGNFYKGVYYFGTWGPLIEDWLKYLREFDLRIEGNLWEKSQYEFLRNAAQNGSVQEGSMAEKASGAEVVVNFIRAQHGCFNSMKTFELAAAGACIVTNRTEEQMDFFEDGRGALFFDSSDEMIDVVKRLLADSQLQHFLRTQAYMDVQSHSYHDRAFELVKYLSL